MRSGHARHAATTPAHSECGWLGMEMSLSLSPSYCFSFHTDPG